MDRRPSPWAGPLKTCIVGSGGRFEGDFVTEGLQFADVVTGAAVAVDAGVVVAGDKVDESFLIRK